METCGRTTIYANYTERQLIGGSVDEQGKKVIDIIQNSVDIHAKNKLETKYLIDYYYGIQDIQNKIKYTRTDINNKGVENWAFAIGELKKGMLVGQPIKYAPFDNIPSEEITKLNKYMLSRNKDDLDQNTYEEMFAAGRSYRYAWTNIDGYDKTPFDLFNLDIENTEVVYSSSIKHEQLLEYIVTPQQQTKIVEKNGIKEEEVSDYNEYTVYTRTNVFILDDKTGKLRITDTKPNAYKKHIIFEYYFNKYRVSALEIIKDILNDINHVENLELDGIEGDVNSIMVFTNAKVDKEKMDAIKEYGAISIKSTSDKKASVELLQSMLKINETQAYYVRKLMSLFTIAGVPQPSGGNDSRAETGKATLVSQGFTSSNMRTENEEKAFKKTDRALLDTILAICKGKNDSGIKEIEAYDFDIIFSRDLSDDIMTKTQALINLATAKIPPEVANAVVHLFSDPVAVTNLQKEYIKELDEKEQEKQNIKINNVPNNNDIENIETTNELLN